MKAALNELKQQEQDAIIEAIIDEGEQCMDEAEDPTCGDSNIVDAVASCQRVEEEVPPQEVTSSQVVQESENICVEYDDRCAPHHNISL